MGASSSFDRGWVVERASQGGSLLLALPFIVKLPVYSLHLWLPLAHVEAPTARRMVLAATILKLGALGLLHTRKTFPLLLVAVSVVGLLLTPLLTFIQRDVKCLVAYTRVAHIAILRLRVSLLSLSSIRRGWLLQVRHGFISSVLFLLIGSISHTLGHRLLYFSSYEDYTSFFLLCVFNAGAPLRLSFLREV